MEAFNTSEMVAEGGSDSKGMKPDIGKARRDIAATDGLGIRIHYRGTGMLQIFETA